MPPPARGSRTPQAGLLRTEKLNAASGASGVHALALSLRRCAPDGAVRAGTGSDSRRAWPSASGAPARWSGPLGRPNGTAPSTGAGGRLHRRTQGRRGCLFLKRFLRSLLQAGTQAGARQGQTGAEGLAAHDADVVALGQVSGVRRVARAARAGILAATLHDVAHAHVAR